MFLGAGKRLNTNEKLGKIKKFKNTLAYFSDRGEA
jgi:hypothetical protein